MPMTNADMTTSRAPFLRVATWKSVAVFAHLDQPHLHVAG